MKILFSMDHERVLRLKGEKTMRQELIEAVKKTQAEELQEANKRFAAFNSRHEGYAVILEEAQEAEMELRQMANNLNGLWELTKQNAPKEDIEMLAEGLEQSAVLLAAEAIQTAAMARKLLDFISSKEV